MTFVSKRRWLILPIETKARELHGKLLLALFAAERGWGVIIGGKPATKGAREQLPRGVIIEKSIPPGRIGAIQAAKAVGNRPSAWDEEGLIYINKEDYVTRRVGAQSLGELDFFFAWGKQQAEDILAEVKKGEEKMILSGNPRLDLLRPEFRGIFSLAAEKIRARYGKILLINTFFRYINSGEKNPQDYLEGLRGAGAVRDERHAELWRRMIALQKAVLPHFVAMLPRLSRAFPDWTIVVRPHPSERDAFWHEAAKGLSNVRVIYEGSANDWIVASEVAIQNNCTTGVEAFLLEKPSVSYRPVKDDGVEFMLPNRLGIEVESEDALVSLVSDIIEGKVDIQKARASQLALARRYIANIDGPPACEVILDTLDTLELPLQEARFPLKQRHILRHYVRKIKKYLALDDPYHRKKFPGLWLHEMLDLRDEFKRVSQRFSGVDIVQVDEDGFCVYRP